MEGTLDRAPTVGRAPAPRRSRRAELAAAGGATLRRAPREHDGARLPALFGALPRGLRGTLLRNGPARFAVGRDRYRHLFDGEGMVTRFTLDGEGPLFSNRFVRTREAAEEERAGHMIYRSFGTNPPGGPLRSALRVRFKNTANTAVIQHAGRLLALWEGGLPHELDPGSLATVGRYDFSGALAPSGWADRALGIEPAFCAHPRLDAATGELWAFGMQLGLSPALRVYRVDAAGSLTVDRTVRLPELSFVHDFALTPRYAVFFVPAVRFDVARLLGGATTAIDALTSAHRPGRILVVPRDGSEVRWLEGPPGFIYHLLNGFELGPGQVVVDGLWMPSYPAHHFGLEVGSALRRGEIPPSSPRRWLIDLDSGRVTTRALHGATMELPAIHSDREGRAYRFAWAVTSSEDDPERYTAIGKLDVPTGELRRADLWPLIPGEPVLAPSPASQREDDGWLLVQCLHAHRQRSVLVVLRASDLEMVAAFEMPCAVPPSLHGSWIAAGRGDGMGGQRAPDGQRAAAA